MYFENLIACINLIRDLDSKEFKNFSEKFKINSEDLFEGYRLMIKTIQRSFLFFLSQSDDIDGLKEDYVLSRLNFRGGEIFRTSDSCEKITLLKNIIILFKSCWKSKDYNELKESLEICEKELFHIFDKKIPSKKKLSEKKMMGLKADLLWTYLSNMQNNCPSGYFLPFLDNHDCDSRKTSIKGYKFALAFFLEKILNAKGKNIEDLISLKDTWENLDKSFSIIREEVEEKKIKECQIENTEKLIHKNLKRDDFREILKNKKYNKYNQTIKERLNELLYQYGVETMPSDFFCGVGGLIIAIKGATSYESKVEIIRFIHPIKKGSNKNDYSYALLIRSGGILTDSSGWILFTEVATDYSGGGGHQRFLIESTLSENRSKIKVREFKISFLEMKKYLKISRKGAVTLASEKRKLRNTIREYKQLSTEALVYTYLLNNGFKVLEWSYNFNMGEIDFIAEKENTIYLIEVTNRLNLRETEIEKLIQEFKRKEKELTKNFKDKKIKKILFVTHLSHLINKNELKKTGAKIMHINERFFSSLKSKINTQKIKEMLNLLNHGGKLYYPF